MDGHYGNRMPYNPGHSPRTPHPAQYFTSGSTPRGGSPMRFSNSTPNQYQQRPPRFQHPNNRYGSSPGGGAYGGYSPSYSSDYPSSPYRPTYSPTPQYTPSPVRPRFNNYNQGASRHSPYHHRGRGGSAGRGGRGVSLLIAKILFMISTLHVYG